ncbi:ATP-dependent DNA ligase [Streptomyces mirabilis]|uniref:ATP-dependent DNA ligase n=1 Tax=Streptomyces mirabilis TaxID=68239 RepID=A0ABU3V523_9ACTN|nr:ATP-dependent DNA ligase [Streptomyces mirabilis]MCX5355615.1 ATP-dependent DNA ligase [Streptomyces mirabilis]MDU9001261.1 ATP-dependent DNA ligase [Streptomyces mirabilis]
MEWRLPETMLAKAVDELPSGDFAYEAKWDGFRAILSHDPHGAVEIRSRQRTLLNNGFPEIVQAAARDLPPVILDGEVVIWHEDRLAFERLLRRLNRRPAAVAAEVRSSPAHFVAFDILRQGDDGTDLTRLPYLERRARLEALFTEHALAPPWTLCPMTLERDQALSWMQEWAKAGIEGIVAKRLSDTYRGGVRGWQKIRVRHTSEAIVGAVTGRIHAPSTLLLGRLDTSGRLHFVGRTTPLNRTLSRTIGSLLRPSTDQHPWTGRTFSAGWGTKDTLDTTLAEPEMVVEVSADISLDASGRWRHPVRLERARPDLTAADVAPQTAFPER